jgi:tripartite ATP-independent transporter DctM subunit
MIVYGALTEESIGKLLIAGILPGIVTAAILGFAAWLQVRVNPSLAPTGEAAPFNIKMQTARAIWPVPVIFLISMGGIWLGVFTATEGGAIGAFLSLLYAILTRQLTWKGLNSALEETANVTAMIFLVIIGGTLYGYFLTATRIPLGMKEFIVSLNLSPLALIALVFLVYFLAGFVMDAMAIIVIFTNLFYPLVTAAGYNGIWFGVITIMLCNIGFLTPPVGPVSMVTASATNTRVEAVFKGVTPYWFALIAATAILIAFPDIATYLPNMMKF